MKNRYNYDGYSIMYMDSFGSTFLIPYELDPKEIKERNLTTVGIFHVYIK